VVQKQFLNESWANLAELEEGLNANVANLEMSTVNTATNIIQHVALNQLADSLIDKVDEGQFHDVVSKATKKAQKSKPTIHMSYNTYPTRSKAVPPRPSI
ncbi:hypothetical protein A2U01_0033482, partial [Trifolium medium]|nr:hypothetical protein [Trifolium medium]